MVTPEDWTTPVEGEPEPEPEEVESVWEPAMASGDVPVVKEDTEMNHQIMGLMKMMLFLK